MWESVASAVDSCDVCGLRVHARPHGLRWLVHDSGATRATAGSTGRDLRHGHSSTRRGRVRGVAVSRGDDVRLPFVDGGVAGSGPDRLRRLRRRPHTPSPTTQPQDHQPHDQRDCRFRLPLHASNEIRFIRRDLPPQDLHDRSVTAPRSGAGCSRSAPETSHSAASAGFRGGGRCCPDAPGQQGFCTSCALPDAGPNDADERTRTSTELPPHGPEPNRGGVAASRSVRCVQIAGFRGRVGRSGRYGCCHDVVTRRLLSQGDDEVAPLFLLWPAFEVALDSGDDCGELAVVERPDQDQARVVA